MSLDGFLGDISDDEVRHRKSSSHRVPPGRRKPEKVGNSELDGWPTQLAFVEALCVSCADNTISVKSTR